MSESLHCARCQRFARAAFDCHRAAMATSPKRGPSCRVHWQGCGRAAAELSSSPWVDIQQRAIDFVDRDSCLIRLNLRDGHIRSFLERVAGHRHAHRVPHFRHRKAEFDMANIVSEVRICAAWKRWLATNRLGKRSKPVAQEWTSRDAEPSSVAIEMLERSMARLEPLRLRPLP